MEDTVVDSTNSNSEQPMSGSSAGKKFKFIEGRRFNDDKDVQYFLPNDDDEADRLHQLHWVIRYGFQCNFHAPIKDKLKEGISVLDSGCGPGTWTFDMAEQYPNSKFTAIDISFVFPEIVRPANVDMHIMNIAKDIEFEDNTFDYFYQRLLILGLSRTDWKIALKNAYRVLKPGGFIELTEPLADYDNSGPNNSHFFTNAVKGIMKQRDMYEDIGRHIASLLEEAGFVNVHHDYKPLPINHSGKAGKLWWQTAIHTYRNLKPVIAMDNPELEDQEKFDEFLAKTGEECEEMKTMFPFYIAYAQKPFEK